MSKLCVLNCDKISSFMSHFGKKLAHLRHRASEVGLTCSTVPIPPYFTRA